MAGRTLGGRYTVQDKIGTGGMAIVYRGLDEVLGRTVAIKTMLPQYANDQSFAARFKQEAQAAAALQSPYIVNVYDWGRDGDTYYIIMEYLRGTDLKSGLRRHGALDCRKVAQIGSQIAQALSVAHRHDIIHRDIKPQNIMVQPDGNIKVMDFGIARAKNSHLTADNSVLGTAHYVSPEQTQGKDLGPTTDIYSLGIVMYEAATGRVPFDGEDAISVALKQVNESPMPPSQINPRVDPSLEAIILKCMQKRPEERFQSADDLYHSLRDYLAGRLQEVSEATSIVSAAARTSQLNRQRSNDVPVTPADTGKTGETTGHYRTKTATEEDYERRHKRNVIVGVVVSLILIAGIAVAAFMIFSKPSTNATPNLMGLTQDEAIAELEKSDYFELGTVKEEYSSKVAEGKILDQDPDPGKSAERGTQINLVVSKGEEPVQTVTVPDLTNLGATDAEKAITEAGLKAQVGDAVFSTDIESGLVADQNPKGGTTAKAGDTVTYHLSKGPEQVEVPYVIGWEQNDATVALQDAGFVVITNSDTSETVDAGYVCFQSVTGQAIKGSEVIITVSLGSAKVSVPNVVGQYEAAASEALSGSGFLVAVNYAESSSVDAGIVMWQSVTGEADAGETITIGVSTGSGNNKDDSTSKDDTTDTEEVDSSSDEEESITEDNSSTNSDDIEETNSSDNTDNTESTESTDGGDSTVTTDSTDSEATEVSGE